MIHVYSQYQAGLDAKRRMEVAQSTWENKGWSNFGIPERSTVLYWGLPMIGDLLDLACQQIKDDEIWVFTNADICVASDAPERISRKLKEQAATYAFRRDFARLSAPIPDAEIQRGNDYCGSDLFAGTKKWWSDNRAQFPKLLLGCEAWDACMRVLMEESNRGGSMAIPNIIYHERHPSKWEAPENRYRIPQQLHNLRLAWTWLMRPRIHPSVFGIKMV